MSPFLVLTFLVSTGLAAPQAGGLGSGSAVDSGSGDYDFSSSGSGSDMGDFTNLTLNRAINTCGCAAVSSTDRIVGGKESKPNSLPYQVLVSPCDKDGHCFMCGGTILNKRYVVTAAHCLYAGPGAPVMTTKDSKFRVMVGQHDHCKANEAGDNWVMASAVIQNPSFDINSPDVDNDIAILKLSKDLTFNDKIKPACLPTSSTKDYSGQGSVISGWGGTKANSPMAPVDQPQQCQLKEAIVQILSPSSTKCSDFLGVSDSTTRLCAWTQGTDACQGDSGGPLTVAEDGKYTLLGVVSYGQGCADSTPGVYTRIQGFLPWIKETIKDGEC